MSDKYFLDTNVLVHAYDTQNPGKQGRAQEVLRRAIETDTGVLSTQVLSEFIVVVTQKIRSPMELDEAQRLVKMFCILPVVEQSVNLIHSSIELSRKNRISFWDSMIIAAAKQAGCCQVFSEDFADGQKYDGVSVRNPFR
ncbi:MAG: hypothetical protein A2Y86_07760 [Candidatus Aminicenantes bacterium RBG_13_62_12]|nr:MAG: hypothetical protein A2Y86_07760 [Candidatus Aminicenantes bacterium RBG_13_62_12]OGD37270.1 MAG: hypothetical protein A2V45_13550 [Candidatus Aminicenantes bacterium RBG_19FT_COMBO_58_17]